MLPSPRSRPQHFKNIEQKIISTFYNWKTLNSLENVSLTLRLLGSIYFGTTTDSKHQ